MSETSTKPFTSRMALALALLCQVIPASAAAQAPALPKTAVQKAELESQVDRHVELATKAFRAEDFDTSVKEWDLAYSLDPAPIFVFNAGQAYRRKGRYKEAIQRNMLFLEKD